MENLTSILVCCPTCRVPPDAIASFGRWTQAVAVTTYQPGNPIAAVLAIAGYHGPEQQSLYWSARFMINVADDQLEQFKQVLLGGPLLVLREAVKQVSRLGLFAVEVHMQANALMLCARIWHAGGQLLHFRLPSACSAGDDLPSHSAGCSVQGVVDANQERRCSGSQHSVRPCGGVAKILADGSRLLAPCCRL